MSQLIKRNMEFLEKLSKLTPEEAKLIIQHSSEENILALTELSINILKGHLEITPETYLQLKQHSDLLRKLAKKSVSAKAKRKWLVRTVNILPCLITPLLSCLGSVLVRNIIEASVSNG